MKLFYNYRGNLYTGGICIKEYLLLRKYGDKTNEYRVFYVNLPFPQMGDFCFSAVYINIFIRAVNAAIHSFIAVFPALFVTAEITLISYVWALRGKKRCAIINNRKRQCAHLDRNNNFESQLSNEGGFKKGAYGWICTQKMWKQGNEEKYAINISSDYLDRDVYSIMATLLHEMCHLYALEKGIQDTSRSGIYHNKKFKQIAENHGLNVSEADTIGWSITTLIDDTRAYVDRICPIKSFRLMQKKPSEKSGTSPKAKQYTSKSKL